MTTCRFCHEMGPEREMVKYARRHYAHPRCYFDAGKQLSDLRPWQIEQLPYRLLMDRGLMDEADRLTKKPA